MSELLDGNRQNAARRPLVRRVAGELSVVGSHSFGNEGLGESDLAVGFSRLGGIGIAGAAKVVIDSDGFAGKLCGTGLEGCSESDLLVAGGGGI